MNPVSAAVIGAGLSGIACARRLSDAGWQIRVFESQRAPGGRIATRRFEAAAFDHGAQYFTVRDSRFRAAIEVARAAGAAEYWRPRWRGGDQEGGELWVGSPGMNSLPRFLSEGLDIEYGARITQLVRTRGGWALIDDRGSGHRDFGFAVLALPAPEAAELAAPHTPLARIQKILLTRLAGHLGRTLPGIVLSDAHLWRHARVEAPLGEPFLLDPSAGIGFCGDWCLDARAEAAFLSGDAIGMALSETRYTNSSGKMRDSQ